MSIKERNRILLIGALVVLVAVVVFRVVPKLNQRIQAGRITTFVQCADAGYPIMESYPRQCRTLDGRNFVEQITATTTTDKSNLIVVDSPKPNETVVSPLVIKGKARGSWFFEASFPVQLVAGDGTVIAQIPAQAKGEWMTTDFVPFEATLSFSHEAIPHIVCIKAPCSNAFLVLKKDNPSGLPQYDNSISIPLVLSPGTTPSTNAGACKPTGCSGEICSDEPVVSTCIYRNEYACYKTAVCERQASGQCGWTQNRALTQCLASVKAEGIK